MEYKDVKEQLIKSMGKQDEGLEFSPLVELLSEIEKDYMELEAQRERVSELEGEVAKLNEDRMKLFLSIPDNPGGDAGEDGGGDGDDGVTIESILAEASKKPNE